MPSSRPWDDDGTRISRRLWRMPKGTQPARPGMHEVVLVVLLASVLLRSASLAAGPSVECDGPYQDKWLDQGELARVLDAHRLWRKTEGTEGQQARLCGANLARAGLQGANLRKAQLQQARLSSAELEKADLGDAQLQGADLAGARLLGAFLAGAQLQGADLIGARLQRASLDWAQLQGANLSSAQLQEADLREANLAAVIFELQPGSLPHIPSLARAYNLDKLTFRTSPHALVELRDAFKKAGLREQERQITYAIEHTRMLLAWDPTRGDPHEKDRRPWLAKLAGKSESLFSYVLFELPADYGMVPGRVLQILGHSIALFSLLYRVALCTARGRAGILGDLASSAPLYFRGRTIGLSRHPHIYLPTPPNAGGRTRLGSAAERAVCPAAWPVLQRSIGLFPRLAGAQRRHLDHAHPAA